MKVSLSLLRRLVPYVAVASVLALGIGTVVVLSSADLTVQAEAPAEPTTTPSPSGSPAQRVAERPRLERDERPKKRKQQKPKRRPQPGSDLDEELVGQVEDLLGTDLDGTPTRFRVATYNVLGHSHTTARGNKPGYAPGTTRMGWSVRMLTGAGVDVVGFQEFEVTQFRAFQRMTGQRFGVFPGPRLGRNPIRNSIAWRKDTWELVQARTIPIPYFRGNRVPMPYVLLEHKESGQGVWFINIHNPTSNKKRGNNERWRDLGTTLQVRLVNRLQSETGLPVVLTGDFNERQEAFCRVTSGGRIRAANGGTVGRPCRPPASMGIDWIFGTTDIAFSGYRTQRTRASDHPFIVADAEVTPQ